MKSIVRIISNQIWTALCLIISVVNIINISAAVHQAKESNSAQAFTVELPKITSSIKYIVTDFGASASEKDNSQPIQKAIDVCSAAGGGIVIIPRGVYLSGPILMKNNVNLHISKDAILRMLPYGRGNGVDEGTYPNNGEEGVYPSFISGEKVQNIIISGDGIIDGDGKEWWIAYRNIKGTSTRMKRGCLIALNESKRVLVSGVKLIDAPNVHMAIGKKSGDVTIDGIVIDTPDKTPNTDGIDVWAPNVEIKNSTISCGDDNVAMDTGTKNIRIKKCFFGRGHGCSIGSYTHNIENVLVDSCVFNGTTSAIRMKSSRNRGGGERDITYSNIQIYKVENPISITSYYPKVPKSVGEDVVQSITENTPSWSNILFRNIVVAQCENAGLIWGLPELSIQNIKFENVTIHARKGMVLNYAKNVIFERTNIQVDSGEQVLPFESSFSGLSK